MPEPVGEIVPDRQVHATHASGMEVVRYERAGKWYLELPGNAFRQDATTRQAMTINQAVLWAVEAGAVFHFGRPGGATFDRKVRAVLTARTEGQS